MILIAIIIGCLIGALIGMYAPMVSYTYSGYLAIAIIAALDSVFGGIVATLKKNFNLTIFITGFFGNAILAILHEINLFSNAHFGGAARSRLFLFTSNGIIGMVDWMIFSIGGYKYETYMAAPVVGAALHRPPLHCRSRDCNGNR